MSGYRIGAVITGIISFFLSWIYAIVTYGFFLGVGLGWLPSLMIALLAALIWPLIALAIIGGVYYLNSQGVFDAVTRTSTVSPKSYTAPTRPPEFFTYMRVLESKIKENWRWNDTNAALVTQVQIEIAPDGTIQSVVVRKSSSNDKYDQSVIDSVKKSSPVPPAPESVYQYFRTVILTFDPRQ